MTITGNPPKKGKPYGMNSRWFFVLQVAWDSISKLMPLILWFFAQECPGVLGGSNPPGVGWWMEEKVRFSWNWQFMDAWRTTFILTTWQVWACYLRILRERSQQTCCASETCWNNFSLSSQKKGDDWFSSTFPTFLLRHFDEGTRLEFVWNPSWPNSSWRPSIKKSAQENICLKSFKRIREVEFSFVWRFFFLIWGAKQGGNVWWHKNPRIKTVESRKQARFHRSDVTFIISTKS